MYLHDSILMAIGPGGASGINIYCEDSMREEVAKFFEEKFAAYWSEAEDAVEEKYGDCNEKEEECGSPATISVTEGGVIAVFEPLYLSFNYGNNIETDGFAEKALKKSLKKLLRKYPEVSYEGYIGYSWSDVHGGDVTQYEISSKGDFYGETDKVYDFVGEEIGFAMEEDEEYFWDEMTEYLDGAGEDDFKQVLKCFHAYSKWIPDDAFDRLLDLADEIDEEIRPSLVEILDAWENGEEVEIKREKADTSNLPEGYMEELRSVINADNEKKDAEIEAELDEEDDEE